jgi:acid phosphatase type 7
MVQFLSLIQIQTYMKNYIISLLAIFISAFPVISQENENQQVQKEPFRISNGPYLQHVGEKGATFVWITNRVGVAWIELAPDDGTHFYHKERPKYFSASHGLKNVSNIHTVRIENLEPGTKYRYRAYSKEVVNYTGTRVDYGNTVATNVYRGRPLQFTTNDHSKDNMSFIMVNDIHGNHDVMGNLLKDVDWENTDLVFFNGDMYSHLNSQEQLFGDFMDTAVEIFASNVPMYYARGNHEARGSYAHHFHKYFPGPNGELYYMFRQGPVSFVVFDSGEDKPDSDIEYYDIVAFDEYMDQQAEWLKEAVHHKDFVSAPFKVAVVHIPPYHPWHGARRIYDKIVPILNEAGVNVMLCGHRHRVFLQPAGNGIDFPVLENGHNTILHAKTEGKNLTLTIKNLDGKIVETLVIPAEELAAH